MPRTTLVIASCSLHYLHSRRAARASIAECTARLAPSSVRMALAAAGLSSPQGTLVSVTHGITTTGDCVLPKRACQPPIRPVQSTPTSDDLELIPEYEDHSAASTRAGDPDFAPK